MSDAIISPLALPKGYLDTGYYDTTDKGTPYLRPEYVGIYAEGVALALSMKASDFDGMIREVKRNNRRSLPFEAKQTAILELYPKALALVRRRKAPVRLMDFVEKNTEAIRTSEDFSAFCRHCEAISGYLSTPL